MKTLIAYIINFIEYLLKKWQIQSEIVFCCQHFYKDIVLFLKHIKQTKYHHFVYASEYIHFICKNKYIVIKGLF